jgi:exonuclease III
MIMGTWVINIYTPSGAEKRSERERQSLYDTDAPFLLPTANTEMIFAGDFNCVLSPDDCTGKPATSRALATLVNGEGLSDMWQTHNSCPAYTHYTNNGASRIDRTYATKCLLDRKKGTETVAAASKII